MINDQTMADAIRKIGDGYTGRTYTTKQGATLPLRPIPSMIIKQLDGDQSGMPKPPMVEIPYGKKIVKEPNEHDPEYKAALEQWQNDKSERIMAYVITRGVCADPGAADIERLREFSPGLTDARLKFAWVLEQLEDENEMAELMIVIMGQTAPTEKGIRDAEATFPGDDQQNGHNEISVAESESND